MIGRPRVYDDAESMQKDIDGYFETETKLTVTGLALALGFESRQSLYDYEENNDFSYIVKKARLRIENGYEKRLHEQACTGAIFALKNMGWKDKTEQDVNLSGGVILNFQNAPGCEPLDYESKVR